MRGADHLGVTLPRARPAESAPPPSDPSPYWALDPGTVLRRLRSPPAGLSSADALDRLRTDGPNQLREHTQLTRVRVLLM